MKLSLKLAPATLLFLALCASASSPSVKIELKHGTDAERRTREQLERLISSNDLGKHTFTDAVLIDETSIPHSHPVLTLHTRHLGQDDLLLSTYVHEQLHWYLAAHRKQTEAAEQDLRKLYPRVPIGYPEGSSDAESTYLHLVVCYFEMLADRDLMGNERAANVMNFWAGDHYRWVYKTVIHDEAKLRSIVDQHGLSLK